MKAITFLALLGMLLSLGATAMDPKIQMLESQFEVRIRDKVRDILGGTVQPVVVVKIKPVIEEVTADDGADTDAEPGAQDVDPEFTDNSEIDLPYLPLPFRESRLKGHPKKSARLPAMSEEQQELEQPALNIESMSVDISLPGVLDDSVRESVSEFVKKAFAQFNPQVQVRTIPLPPSAKSEKPEGHLPINPLVLAGLALVGILLGSGIVAFGISTIAKAVKSASSSMTEGLVSVSNTSINKSSESRVARPKTTATAADSPSAAQASEPAPPPNFRSLTQNIRLIRQELRQDATAFARTVGQSAADATGLKRLLTQLDEEEQSLLKKSLGEHRISRLSEIEDADQSDGEFGVWAQRLCERLILRRVRGGSEVERNLNPEQTQKLMSVKPTQLQRAASHANSPAGWRVAAEFLPKDQFARAISEATEPQLLTFLEAASCPEADLQQAASSLIENLQTSDGPDEAEKNEHRDRYLTDYLLGPVVEAMGQKPLAEVGRFIETIQNTSADFAKLIKDRFWIPADLDHVPSAFLKKEIGGLSHDQRVDLILGLPKAQSERVRALLPGGNALVIANDKIKKALARNDAERTRRAGDFSRQFIDRQRLAAQAGEFKWQDEAAEAPPAEQVSAAVAAELQADSENDSNSGSEKGAA